MLLLMSVEAPGTRTFQRSPHAWVKVCVLTFRHQSQKSKPSLVLSPNVETRDGNVWKNPEMQSGNLRKASA